jgi:GT2 family glycosyltransferase
VLSGVLIFAIPDLTRICLRSLISTPTDVLVVDNCAPQDVKEEAYRYGDRIKVITMAENTYCNGGWNEIMQYGLEHDYDLIGLGSSDVELHPGWYNLVINRATEHPDEIILPRVGEPVSNADINNVTIASSTPGFFTFLPKQAVAQVYPIPRGLRHWFGDEYMFTILRQIGWKTVILNDFTAYHQWSSNTAQNPEAYRVIEQDKLEWQRLRNQHLLQR